MPVILACTSEADLQSASLNRLRKRVGGMHATRAVGASGSGPPLFPATHPTGALGTPPPAEPPIAAEPAPPLGALPPVEPALPASPAGGLLAFELHANRPGMPK